MRVTCPHCQRRFDLAHRKVIEEAARLRGDTLGTLQHGDAQANGNVLDPNDKEAARQRAEAIARRLQRHTS